jgi:PKD repeat protein
MPGTPITFEADTMGAGTDEITFIWDWGDTTNVTEKTYYYDDSIPDDPLPSPYEPYFGGTLPPIYVTDTQTHVYSTPGTYTVTLTVIDDDGGTDITTLTISVNGGLYCPKD